MLTESKPDLGNSEVRGKGNSHGEGLEEVEPRFPNQAAQPSIQLSDLNTQEATLERGKQAKSVLGDLDIRRNKIGRFQSITLLNAGKFRLLELWAWGYNPKTPEICIWGYRIEKKNKTKWVFFKDYDTLKYAYNNFQCFLGLIKSEEIRPSESIAKEYA